MRRMKGDLKKLWSRLPLGQSRFWFDAAALAAALCMLGIAALHWAGDVVTDGARALGEPVAPSLLIDRQGKQLGVLTSPQYGYRGGELERQLPSLLKEAFVATEDKRFYSHGGVDFRALLRAAAANVSSGRIVEGGSSITQQLARTAYLSNEKSLLRKALEMAAALSLERRYSKEELLRQYLGRVYMGKQLYGVKAAAERYFGVSRLESLELWQIATLAAMPKGPALYNPIDYPERSKERRQVVLRLMREQGYITQRQMEAAGAVDYTAPAAPKKTASASLAEVVFREAEERASLTEEELLGGGYTVAIGLDAGLQAGLENLSSLDAGFPKSSFGRPVQAAAVVLDNGTAEIMAFAGGSGATPGGFNRAFARRQPGSAFKPISVYGPALETGLYAPDSMLEDRKARYGSYAPRNPGGVYRGSISMRQAVQNSVNAPAVWLLQQIGLNASVNFASGLGIRLRKEDRHLAIALGGLSSGVTPVEMAQAYRAFAAGGSFEEAHLIRSIADRHGNIVYAFQPAGKRAMSAQTAAAMTSMLQGAAQEGTGRKAGLGPGVAGKTGTTQLEGGPPGSSRDAWFVGYTARYTASVWMGLDKAGEEHMAASGVDAARLFAAIARVVDGPPAAGR
ncbi:MULTISPECIES: PBP1A family penicillin-binding protein [unclassified Paenibacillus]|uniref:transglycosylase domain-containing protein n=1 Tax=unclassified Paenibacillus TaxID=185978 RepID=UPI000955F088|nr:MULTISPECIES: PBP1A family penicillin-binding protein [unclassified Paenibacillus]ASS66457.2 PBP1A family penicillin-binding protein [Paenibacillus sp. RUD330]SIQ03776.1 penicillin-binding protein 2A [Paenibacillus sp. RU4X]SIQ23643.1 penicillin-binding protein 2A [Paenibacillus sp. RU4T]